MAMTADGKIDTVERLGARISGPADTARVDRLRADSDAIMVGGNTLLAEDPRLTVRDTALIDGRTKAGRPTQPMKVGVISVVAPDAIAADGAFLHEGQGHVLVCTSERTSTDAIAALEAEGAQVLVAGSERADLAVVLATLSDLGVERLMVEGGSTLVAALLADGLVDELQLAIAPLLFGGATAPTPVGGDGWLHDDALGLELTDTSRSADGDVVVCYRVLGRDQR